MKKNQNALWLTFTCLLLMCSMESYAQNTSVSGKIKTPQPDAEVYLVKWDLNEGNHAITDTVEVSKEGNFSFTVPMNSPEIYLLSFYRKQTVMLVLEPNQKITLNVDGENGGQASVTGSKDTDLLIQFNQKRTMLQEQKLRPLVDLYQAAQEAGNETELLEITADYEKESAAINEVMQAYILNEMSNSVAAYAAYPDWESDAEMKLMQQVVKNVEKERPGLALTQDIQAKITRMARFAIGAEAPNIEEVNPEGEKVSLASLRGQYVLIDFWASWCGPCRQENPNVVRTFEKYKDKGFTVFGVSLDNNKEKWIKAIADDELNWPQVSDLGGWQAAPAALYNVRSIPANFLLDKEGRIIAKDLRGEALEAKVAELFAEGDKADK